MSMNRDELCDLIPHAGAMCLLDTVRDWDATRIACLTGSHRRQDNPLRRGGRLSIVHAVEYGAQAAAVHGGLLARAHGLAVESGYLAAARDLRFAVPYLDELGEPLMVGAEQQMGDSGNLIYGFEVGTPERIVANGRIVVMCPRGEQL